jgi:hypothetical protein
VGDAEPGRNENAFWNMTVIEVRAIAVSVEKRSDCSQWIYDAAGNVIEMHEHKGEFKEVLKTLQCVLRVTT